MFKDAFPKDGRRICGAANDRHMCKRPEAHDGAHWCCDASEPWDEKSPLAFPLTQFRIEAVTSDGQKFSALAVIPEADTYMAPAIVAEAAMLKGVRQVAELYGRHRAQGKRI